MSIPNEDFHEVWWIASDKRAEMRIAHFRKTADGTDVVVISDEPPGRIGMRIWKDIAPREEWYKVTRIAIPTQAQRDAARDQDVS